MGLSHSQKPHLLLWVRSCLCPRDVTCLFLLERGQGQAQVYLLKVGFQLASPAKQSGIAVERREHRGLINTWRERWLSFGDAFTL